MGNSIGKFTTDFVFTASSLISLAIMIIYFNMIQIIEDIAEVAKLDNNEAEKKDANSFLNYREQKIKGKIQAENFNEKNKNVDNSIIFDSNQFITECFQNFDNQRGIPLQNLFNFYSAAVENNFLMAFFEKEKNIYLFTMSKSENILTDPKEVNSRAFLFIRSSVFSSGFQSGMFKDDKNFLQLSLDSKDLTDFIAFLHETYRRYNFKTKNHFEFDINHSINMLFSHLFYFISWVEDLKPNQVENNLQKAWFFFSTADNKKLGRSFDKIITVMKPHLLK